MPKFKKFLANADSVSRLITGTRLSDNATRVWEFFTAQLAQPKPTDSQDTIDCEVLGISPGASERVVKAAWRIFALDAHPDRKGGSDEIFKRGRTAYEGICKRRGGRV